MKKNTLLFCLAVLLVIFLCSCGGGLLPGNQIGVMVTNWNAGPGVSQATVTVFESGTQKVIGNGVSNKNGGVIVNLSAKPELIDISVVKEGHARSFVSGLKSTFAVNQIFPIILQSALLENDPGIETDPTVTIQWELMAPQTTRDVGPSQELVKGPFEVTVTVEGVRQTRVIYEPLLDSIPGSASVTLNSGLSKFADTATFEVAPTGFDGEVPLYTTVYDSNNNRVVKVIYLAIEGTEPEGVQMYQPMPLVDFSERVGDYPIENIRSYTRRDSENLRNEGRTAPAETNLWTQLYWTDWTSLDDYYGPGSLLPDPGDQPDGYNLYRSGDGQSYQKVAFISEASVGGVAKTICEAINWSNIDSVVNTNPMGLDGSFYVFPEFPI